MIDVHFDAAVIKKQLDRLKNVPYAVQKALYPAISDALQHTRTTMAEQLTATVPLAPKLIAASIKLSMNFASAHAVEGSVTVLSKAIPLIHYGVTPKTVTAQKGQRPKQWAGFSYTLQNGQTRTREALIGRQSSGIPFIAHMRNSTGKRRNGVHYASQSGDGHLGVYAKTPFGKIKELYGPTLQYHATTPTMEQTLINAAHNRFNRILPHMVDAVLQEQGDI